MFISSFMSICFRYIIFLPLRKQAFIFCFSGSSLRLTAYSNYLMPNWIFCIEFSSICLPDSMLATPIQMWASTLFLISLRQFVAISQIAAQFLLWWKTITALVQISFKLFSSFSCGLAPYCSTHIISHQITKILKMQENHQP